MSIFPSISRFIPNSAFYPQFRIPPDSAFQISHYAIPDSAFQILQFRFRVLPKTMSLAPKIDEIRHSVLQTDVDLASFIETWLTDFVHDNVKQISGYNVIYKRSLDWPTRRSLPIYKGVNTFEILTQYHSDQFEVLWVKVRPRRLQRGVSCIIIGTIYHPPSISKSMSFNFVTITRETKRLLALLLPKLTGHSLILFHHVMKNGLPLNRLFEREWTFSFP